MTTAIWKYTVPMREFGSIVEVAAPQGATFLPSAQAMGDDFAVWAEVDPAAPLVPHRLMVIGTGHPLPICGSGVFLGTAIWNTPYGMTFVGHMFQLKD